MFFQAAWTALCALKSYINYVTLWNSNEGLWASRIFMKAEINHRFLYTINICTEFHQHVKDIFGRINIYTAVTWICASSLTNRCCSNRHSDKYIFGLSIRNWGQSCSATIHFIMTCMMKCFTINIFFKYYGPGEHLSCLIPC